MSRFHDIHQLAARQHGNVSVDQLHDLGLTERMIRSRVTGGLLIPRHRGVYAVGHVPATRESRWHAAVLALGEAAVLSHRAAAALWGILHGAIPTEVTVPSYMGVTRRDGIIVHRSPITASRHTTRSNIPVTTLVQTVMDVASVLPVPRLRGVFEEAQVQHGLQPEVVAAETLCRRGHRGNARIRSVLEGAVDPAGVVSILELRFLGLCQRHDIPRPHVNRKEGAWTPDFTWPNGLVVETDGGRFHQTAAKRARDAAKDAALTEKGYRIIRLTWADVTEFPTLTAARVREALETSR